MGEISLQLALKRYPSLGPLIDGNENNTKKSRFCPNRNSTGTIYPWSIILRSFIVVSNWSKRDANGFFKVLLPSSHPLSSRHPVRKSKFGTCAVTGYCSFTNMRSSKVIKFTCRVLNFRIQFVNLHFAPEWISLRAKGRKNITGLVLVWESREGYWRERGAFLFVIYMLLRSVYVISCSLFTFRGEKKLKILYSAGEVA